MYAFCSKDVVPRSSLLDLLLPSSPSTSFIFAQPLSAITLLYTSGDPSSLPLLSDCFQTTPLGFFWFLVFVKLYYIQNLAVVPSSIYSASTMVLFFCLGFDQLLLHLFCVEENVYAHNVLDKMGERSVDCIWGFLTFLLHLGVF